MSDYQKVLRRKREVAQRAKQGNAYAGACKVFGCGRPARAAAGEGLDNRFCRAHAEFFQRHGSPYKRSYTAAELKPFRRAALAWVEANEADRFVANAIHRVRGLYASAGPHVEAFRLRGLPPADRARAAWARLRKAERDPREVVAAWLAIRMAVEADPQPVTTREFMQVQAAKLIHRMASGTHRRWERSDGVVEMHVYPHSRGQVLRHVGAALEEAVELLWDRAEVRAQLQGMDK